VNRREMLAAAIGLILSSLPARETQTADVAEIGQKRALGYYGFVGGPRHGEYWRMLGPDPVIFVVQRDSNDRVTECDAYVLRGRTYHYIPAKEQA
jgi:hypothetical protein